MNHAPTVNEDGDYELTEEDLQVEAARQASQDQNEAIRDAAQAPPTQADMDDDQAINDFQERYSKPSSYVIGGWQSKKFSDPAAVNSMTPFIKLYCIYSAEELGLYENVLANNKWMREQPDQWLESGRELFDPKIPDGFVDSLYSSFQIEFVEGGDEGSKRVIKSIISKSEEGGGIYATDMTFALPQGPDNNWDGGFGVIDMQSTKMTDTPFVENFSMKIQLNNPRLIKERYEYNKLITVGSHFLIMYGWSDGSETGLYDAENKKIFLDTNDEGFYNWGNWRWVVVQLHKFNFNFNELGQMEGTLDFISAQNSDIIFNMNSRMSSIAQYSMYFLNSRFVGGKSGLEQAEATVGTFDSQGNQLDYEVTQETTLIQTYANVVGVRSSGTINLTGLLDEPQEHSTNSDASSPWEKVSKKPGTFVEVLKAMNGLYGEVIIYLPARINTAGTQVLRHEIAGYWIKDKGFIATDFFISLGNGPANSPGAGAGDLAPSKAAAMSYTGVGGNGKESGWVKSITTGQGTDTIPGSGGVNYLINDPDKPDVWDPDSHGFDYRYFGAKSWRSKGSEGASQNALNAVTSLNNKSSFQNDATKFAGHQLWEEISELLTCSDTDKETIKNMKEGVSVTTMDGANTISEDIIYYNLGWIITALIYYNNKLGSGRLDIRYGNLSPQLRVNDNFRYSSTNTVRDIYAESNKENSYDPANFKSLLKASLPPNFNADNLWRIAGERLTYPARVNQNIMREALKSVERIERWMVDEFYDTRSAEDDWMGGGVGLYYNELLSYFSGADLISAKNTSSAVWGPPDQYGRQLLTVSKLDYGFGGTPSSAAGAVSANLTFDKVNSWFDGVAVDQADYLSGKIYKKGDDLFFGINVVIPFLKPIGNDGGQTISRVALTGTDNIDRIVKIPMEASRVDEVFSNAIGTAQSPSDIIQKILTDCCSIDGLGLGVITRSNGSLVIEAAGGMKVETEAFNMDYTEEELNQFSEGNNFILDYRSRNSLIKNLAVAGSMDPNISFLYGNSIRQQNSKATIMSAINQRSRTNPNDFTFTEFAKNWLFKNQERESAQVTVAALEGADLSSIQNGVIDNESLGELLESLPDDLYSAYLATDYTLYEQLQIEQMNSSNSVNSLFTYYMNQITAKIHGITGLECFQIIQLKNVAGLIDGFYCIIGITDTITTSSFDTELKLMLLAPSTVLEGQLQS